MYDGNMGTNIGNKFKRWLDMLMEGRESEGWMTA